MTHYASRDEAAEYAEGLTDAQLRCRERGHGSNMKPFTARYWTDEKHPTVVVERVLRCPCKVRLVQWLDSENHPVRQKYDYSYAEGYLAKDFGRMVGVARDAIRGESVARELVRFKAEKPNGD